MITEDQLEQQCLGSFRDGGWETVFITHRRLVCEKYQRK
jgi:hypothetical protein